MVDPSAASFIISIHAPRGGSDFFLNAVHDLMPISIHAPRGGSDDGHGGHIHGHGNFNPRSPWGERHCSSLPARGNSEISIHAPRGGSDTTGRSSQIYRRNFNPRSPWGERLSSVIIYHTSIVFQSTLPVGGATVRLSPLSASFLSRFQSTLPVGGATSCCKAPGGPRLFQSTLPVGGATYACRGQVWIPKFQSTLPVGGATSG